MRRTTFQKNLRHAWSLVKLVIAITVVTNNLAVAQHKKILKAAAETAFIEDGEHVKMDWRLDPTIIPDIYYVNIPAKKSTVTFKTDQEQLIFHTEPGKSYDFKVLLNNKDTCNIRIASTLPKDFPRMHAAGDYPLRFPFRMIGSRIYFDGLLNNKKAVIQFDFGAGMGAVNRNSSEKLDLSFTSHVTVSNTNGVNKTRNSIDNLLKIGAATWQGVPFAEVSNMEPYEDVIIGNTFFRNNVIEIDYDKMEFIVHSTLPSKVKDYKKATVFFEQNRPKFKARFVHNGKEYDFWFLFDTGRDGTMLLGEDFTSRNGYWEELKPLTIINGRKIIRLNAEIAGVWFNDIVTNVADPSKPGGRSSLFGNQILNHFNIVLDNKNGMIFLKPNSRRNEPYSDYNSYLKEIAKMQGK